MMAPGLVAEFARTFEAETRQAAKESRERSRATARELATLRREIDRLVDAIAQGAFSPALRDRLEALERRRAELETGMPEEAAPATLALPPRLDLLYARKLAELEGLVADPRALAAGDGAGAGADHAHRPRAPRGRRRHSHGLWRPRRDRRARRG